MSGRQPRYSKEEFARRGNEIYQRDIRPHVEAQNKGKIVAIDIETGAHEIADDTVTASERLFQRVPDAQISFVRIGHPAAHRIGRRPLSNVRRDEARPTGRHLAHARRAPRLDGVSLSGEPGVGAARRAPRPRIRERTREAALQALRRIDSKMRAAIWESFRRDNPHQSPSAEQGRT